MNQTSPEVINFGQIWSQNLSPWLHDLKSIPFYTALLQKCGKPHEEGRIWKLIKFKKERPLLTFYKFGREIGFEWLVQRMVRKLDLMEDSLLESWKMDAGE